MFYLASRDCTTFLRLVGVEGYCVTLSFIFLKLLGNNKKFEVYSDHQKKIEWLLSSFFPFFKNYRILVIREGSTKKIADKKRVYPIPPEILQFTPRLVLLCNVQFTTKGILILLPLYCVAILQIPPLAIIYFHKLIKERQNMFLIPSVNTI